MDILAKVLEQSAKLMEEKVDEQLNKLDRMDDDELDKLKERRLEALKKAQKQKQVIRHILRFSANHKLNLNPTPNGFKFKLNLLNALNVNVIVLFHVSCFFILKDWLSKGHGEYREIASEKDFFGEVKESKNVVCHFYRDSTFR